MHGEDDDVEYDRDTQRPPRYLFVLPLLEGQQLGCGHRHLVVFFLWRGFWRIAHGFPLYWIPSIDHRFSISRRVGIEIV